MEETFSRARLLRRLVGRDKPAASLPDLERYVVPEEERMMGWMSLRNQLVQALSDNDPVRLERYVSASCRAELELERLLGVPLPQEKPAIEVVDSAYLGAGTALFTIRERTPTALSECLFPTPSCIEAYIQVVAGDWLVREIRPAAAV
jgi:hypothetical protein